MKNTMNLYLISSHFTEKKDKSDYHEQLGLNFKFTDIQATVGLTQLRKLEKFITRKNQIQKRYLKNIENDKFRVVDFKNYELPWFHTLEFKNPGDLSNVQKLHDNNVESRSFYPPLSQQKYLKNSSATDLNKLIGLTRKVLVVTFLHKIS